jgi:hypothetical protein
MEEGITFVALDAHKVENQVAMLLAGGTSQRSGIARTKRRRFVGW